VSDTYLLVVFSCLKFQFVMSVMHTHWCGFHIAAQWKTPLWLTIAGVKVSHAITVVT